MAFSSALFAQSSVGNGGDVVQCDDGRMELLDIHEGYQQPDFVLDIPEQGNYFFKAHLTLNKLRILDRELSRSLRNYLLAIVRDSLTPGTPPDVDDEGDFTLDPGCSLHQLVTQRLDDGRHFVFAPEFEQLDEDNKAATIIHEVVYAFALDAGHVNSQKAREFVRLLISTRASTITDSEYQRLKSELNFDTNHRFVEATGSSTRFDFSVACIIADQKANLLGLEYCQDAGFNEVIEYELGERVGTPSRYSGRWTCSITNIYLCRK